VKTDPEKLFFLGFIFLMAGLFLHANPLSSPTAAGTIVSKSIFCPGPGVSPLPDTVRACGDSVVLDAGTGYRSYLWNTGDTTQQITVTQFGLYTVTLKTASGSTVKYSSYVSMVKAKILNKDTTICQGQGVNLSVSKIEDAYDTTLVDQFVMSFMMLFDRIVKTEVGETYFVTSSGTYSYWSDSNRLDAFYDLSTSPPSYKGMRFGGTLLGCNYDITPSPQIYNPLHQYCSKSFITGTNKLEFSMGDTYYNDNSGGLNFSVYHVSLRSVHILWATGDTTVTINVSPTVTTTYTVIISDGITSCRDSVTIYVSTPVTPSVSIRSSTMDTCTGSNIIFSAQTLNGGNSPCYQWKVNGQNTGKDSCIFTTSSLVNKDVVSCQLTAKETCITTATATSNNIPVVIHSWVSPAVTISAPTNSICQGSSITFTASPVNEGDSPVYQWILNGQTIGGKSSDYAGSTYTTSSLVNGDIVNCVSGMSHFLQCVTSQNAVSNSIPITVYPVPAVSVGEGREIIKGDHIQLNSSASGGNLSLKWIPDLYLSNDTIADPEATPLETTSYQLKVTSDKGCVATAGMTVKVLGLTIPNAFSPNGDGINDVWRITGTDQFPSVALSIFNRYGQLVYQSNNYNNSWDGKLNGQPLPVATYYYVIKLGGFLQPLSGSVTILR
jgi:gliding motility-associated-like protein